jgi:pimeloyl-ACP methyl ester carboxylesterase
MEKLIRDGVALAYETRGQGDPPILLVHGWTCDHTYFAPQAEHFSRNHRVISVDLRGHGESDKPEQD